MKKLMTALMMMALATVAVPSYGMLSIYEIRREARFLTDRMGHELGLSTRQYNDVYEINFDFYYEVNEIIDDVVRGYDDAIDYYYFLLDQRNEDLDFVLRASQYRRFLNRDYFYRPLYLLGNSWGFRIYSIYSDRAYFYFNIPSHYYSYVGGHSRFHFEISFYHNRYTFRHFGRPNDYFLWHGGYYHHGYYDGWHPCGFYAPKPHYDAWRMRPVYENSRRNNPSMAGTNPDLIRQNAGYEAPGERKTVDNSGRVQVIESKENTRAAGHVTSATSTRSGNAASSTSSSRSGNATSTSSSRSGNATSTSSSRSGNATSTSSSRSGNATSTGSSSSRSGSATSSSSSSRSGNATSTSSSNSRSGSAASTGSSSSRSGSVSTQTTGNASTNRSSVSSSSSRSGSSSSVSRSSSSSSSSRGSSSVGSSSSSSSRSGSSSSVSSSSSRSSSSSSSSRSSSSSSSSRSSSSSSSSRSGSSSSRSR